jgi:TonB family protein
VLSADFAAAASGLARVKFGSATTGAFGDRSTARLGEDPPMRQSSATTGAFGAVNPRELKPTIKASVTQSEFGAVVAKTAGPAIRSQSSDSRSASLEILQKPRPAYSDEARRLQIEGEVVLEMLFPASGRPRVLRVIRGLGHGLDESAVNAAVAIRFRPAMERGTAIDTVATVRIEFQLAF